MARNEERVVAERSGREEVEWRISEARGSFGLDLSGLSLESLPESIGQLTQLTTLALNGNQLTSLPEFIGQLTQLTTLSFRENPLPIPNEILRELTVPAAFFAYWRIHVQQNSSNPTQTAHIDRAIEFPPEYRQAGLGILNYFTEVIERQSL